MNQYRIWTIEKKAIDVEAECPSLALEKANVKGYYWKIERIIEKGEKENMITELTNRLTNSMENDTPIVFDIDSNNIHLLHTIRLDDFSIVDNELNLVAGNFEIGVNLQDVTIEQYDDRIVLKLENMEIGFEFI